MIRPLITSYFILLIGACFAQAGANDTTFNPNQGADNVVADCSLLSDGKILIAGSFSAYNGIARTGIARINSEGSLDTTFVSEAQAEHTILSVVAEPDGKVLIGGYFTTYGGTAQNNIARLNGDGSLDNSFNSGTGTDFTVMAMMHQPDGKILICGDLTHYNGTARSKIARLNSDGSLDTTFDPGPGPDNRIESMALQADGKILIGGNFLTCDNIPRRCIARLNTDGTMDTTFDPGTGVLGTIAGGSDYGDIWAIAVQPDGKILLGGLFTQYDGMPRNNIARVNSDGSLDATFDPGTGLDYRVRNLVLFPNGKILILGDFETFDEVSRRAIARVYDNGILDLSFNPGMGVGGGAWKACMQPDGKAFIVGDFTIYGGALRRGVARILMNDDSQSQVVIKGQVSPCVGNTYDVHIQSGPGVLPALDATVQTGPDCSYSLNYYPTSTTGYLHATISCDGGITLISDSVYFNLDSLTTDTVSVDLTCGVGSFDCNNIFNGPALPGSACDDGDASTGNDMYGSDCVCAGQLIDCLGVIGGTTLPGTTCDDSDATTGNDVYGSDCVCAGQLIDCLGVIGGTTLPGTACDDSDATTGNDVYGSDCVCAGQLIDCLGAIGGNALVGTACDDGDPTTINDTWDINCICSGDGPSPCQAMFNLAQALDDDSVPIPNVLSLYNTSNGGSGVYTYTWDFGDGFTSTENTPVHSYTGNGPYWLCLTIDDGLGCTDTYCDSVSVDDNGIFTGVLGGGGTPGFTINVIDQTMGITELHSTPSITIWPNPASDMLNVTLVDGITGTTTLTVTDMSGSVVRSLIIDLAKGKNQLDIPIGELSDGLYMLRIGNASGYMSQRFVKMR